MNGVIRWVINNSPAVNIFVTALLIVGAIIMVNLRRASFPEFQIEVVLVTVQYPGASPSEVEEGICQKIEEAVRSIEGIDEITSVAREGVGFVVIELVSGIGNIDKVVNEIRNGVDQIPSFPELSEDPDVKQVTFRTPAVRLVVYGGQEIPDDLDPEQRSRMQLRQDIQLREVAETVRDDLLNTEAISTVDLIAARDFQIDVEIPEERLRAYDLSLLEAANRIRLENIELPAGDIKAAGSEYLVRGKNKRLTGDGIAELPLIRQADGTILDVGDIGEVRDGFADQPQRNYVSIYDEQTGLANQYPAMLMTVLSTNDEDIIKITDSVRDYAENVELPPGYGIETYDDVSIVVRDRLDTLSKNGVTGLILVLVVLSLFLEFRLAFWVALGIPVSVAGAFAVMSGLDVTLNFITSFAFILALGIVVDDAIVVGENVFRHREMGKSLGRAAIDGTAEVLPAVTTSVLTTVMAFMPLLFVSGTLGKVIAVMPVVVISMLLFSLFESFLILPNHLAHKPGLFAKAMRGIYWLFLPILYVPVWLFRQGPMRAYGWLRRGAEAGLNGLIQGIYTPIVRAAVAMPLIVVSGAVAALLLCVGLVLGGFTPFVVFPKIDGNFIRATVSFPRGTPAEFTDRALRQIGDGFNQLQAEYESERGRAPGRLLVRSVGYSEIQSAGATATNEDTGSHVGQVSVELIDSASRPDLRSAEILARWREIVGEIPGADKVSFAEAAIGPAAKPIEFKLVGRDLDQLRQLADVCKDYLETQVGVFDIQDDAEPGKPELQVRVKPEAEALGVDTQSLARTVRATYYGEEVMRLQRGRHEVKLMVRYPEDERNSLLNLDEIRIRSREGEIPLREVAQIDERRGYSEINRVDQLRSVTVTADLDEDRANARAIMASMQREFFPKLVAENEGIEVRIEGQQKDSEESVGSLIAGFGIAMCGMFVLLTIQFRSYLQPAFILTIVPFGLIGAILGHLLLGLPLTLFSLFGLVALSGVLVNDSIVLIDFINRKVNESAPVIPALIEAGQTRFRPVLLTSMTTIVGVAPLLFEKSLQVQILIPMATSLAFGLLLATLLVLVLVPSLYAIYARYIVGIDPKTGALKSIRQDLAD